MSNAPEDHEILDIIFLGLESNDIEHYEVTRESECIEFRDPESGRSFEIVVREIDGLSDEDVAEAKAALEDAEKHGTISWDDLKRDLDLADDPEATP